MIKINQKHLKVHNKEEDGSEVTYYPTTLLYQVTSGGRILLISREWKEDLVKGLLRDYTVTEAILIASRACQGCQLLLANQYGVSWGRDERSEEWQSSSKGCIFCRN